MPAGFYSSKLPLLLRFVTSNKSKRDAKVTNFFSTFPSISAQGSHFDEQNDHASLIAYRPLPDFKRASKVETPSATANDRALSDMASASFSHSAFVTSANASPALSEHSCLTNQQRSCQNEGHRNFERQDQGCEKLEQFQSALANSGHHELTRVRVILDDDALRLCGQVSSYFMKQVAQETVRPLAIGLRIENQVRVTG
tara:strand:+ start:155630 stop:156226 length:597 start_codon:yes stop_codon:yes gene_type:complete